MRRFVARHARGSDGWLGLRLQVSQTDTVRGSCVKRTRVEYNQFNDRPFMSKHAKTLEKILGGMADKNIAFRDVRSLLKHLGFAERIKGDHYIFSKDGIEEILNLQPNGSKAKAYQVKQVRNLILRYQLGDLENE